MSVAHKSTHKSNRCESDRYLESTPCLQEGKVELNGLMLCEKHALEAKLEGQITCWSAMLAHIDLWSREASRRDRPDIERLLDLERAKATSALERAAIELHLARGPAQSLLCSVCVLDEWLEENEEHIDDEVRIRRVRHWRELALEQLRFLLNLEHA